MKKIILFSILFFPLLYSQGVRSINGQQQSTQRITSAYDDTASYFRFSATNGIHTLYIPYNLSPTIDTGGISSLNGLVTSTQVFAIDTTYATSPVFVSSGSTHTLRIPMARINNKLNSADTSTFRTASNAYYAPKIGSTNITTLGTIGTGVWQGTDIDIAYLDTTKLFVKTQNNIVTNPNYFTARQNMTSLAVDTILAKSSGNKVYVTDSLSAPFIAGTTTIYAGTSTANMFRLSGGALDHGYISFYPNTIAAGRKAYLGFPTSGSRVFTFANEYDGNSSFSFLDTVSVTGNLMATATIGATTLTQTYVSSLNYQNVRFGSSGLLGRNTTDELYLFANAYSNAGDKYSTAGNAVLVNMASGAFVISTAGAGVADGAVTWSEKFSISNAGVVTLSNNLAVNGDAITSDGDLTITPAGGDVNVVGALSATTLSDLGTNAGSGTIGAGDSLQVTVTGLTTATGVATVAYKRTGATATATADTIASYNINVADKITLYGKFGWVVSYVIGKR